MALILDFGTKMKKSLITLTVMLTAAVLVAVFCSPAMAKVTGVCSNCHTMHNSQNGRPMVVGGSGAGWDADGNWVGDPQATPIETLLIADCVGCHTSTSNQTIIEAGGSRIPIVYNTVEPNKPLAGGNFYWVNATGYGDAYGHNVYGISDEDELLSEAPGNQQGCGSNGGDGGMERGCHYSLAEIDDQHQAHGGKTGCEGCHYYVSHHDSGTPNTATSAYRFLEGHNPDCYVIGKEDSDWEANPSPTVHNEYKGEPDDFAWDGDGFSNLHRSKNMSSYCKGCHSDFHWQTATKTDLTWVRHPSDAVLPIEGEYTAYTIYNPVAPVARPDPLDVAAPGLVSHGADGDMVMCLSCHRPHGSPYADLLRWQYTGDGGCEAQDTSKCGCFVCHTQKGTYE